MPITHAFVSPKSDGADTDQVQPSDWNADHIGVGGTLSISNNIVATDESLTGNSTWVDLATVGPAVTATVAASGVVKITITCRTTGAGYGDMGFAASGANTIAAGTADKIFRTSAGGGFDAIGSATFLLTGLTVGSTTFTAKYNQQGGGGTTHWYNREIIVEIW